MVDGQADDLQARHVAFPLEAMELADESVSARGIRIMQVKAAELWIKMAFQRVEPDGDWPVGGGRILQEFPVTAIADAGLPRATPQVVESQPNLPRFTGARRGRCARRFHQ